jgi:hypothetical protein
MRVCRSVTRRDGRSQRLSAGADCSTFTAGAVRAEEMAGANIISAGAVTVVVTAKAEVMTASAEEWIGMAEANAKSACAESELKKSAIANDTIVFVLEKASVQCHSEVSLFQN